MTKRKVYFQYLSFFMTIVMLIGCFDFSSLSVQANEDYTNTLDDWTINVEWNNQPDNPVTTDTTIRQKLTVTYFLSHATRTYAAGDVILTVPGIGGVCRSNMLTAESATEQSDSEWKLVKHNVDDDTYVFTNKNEISNERSISGGFEMAWTFNSRNGQNGFKASRSPTLQIIDSVNNDTVGKTATLPPLEYELNTERDLYRIYLTYQNINGTEYDVLAGGVDDYLWFKYQTDFNVTRRARGIYTSDHFVEVKLPESAADEDYQSIQVKRNYTSAETISLEQMTDPVSGNTVWGFYEFDDKHGDICSLSTGNYFYLGFPQKFVGQKINVTSKLIALYNDETEPVKIAAEQEQLIDQIGQTVQTYSFTYNGYNFWHKKYNTLHESYGFYDINSENIHNPPPEYSYNSRLLTSEIYNNHTIEFVLTGGARRDYSSGGARAVLNDTEEPQSGISKINDVEETEPAANIGQNEAYTFVQGDDRLYIQKSNGNYRLLDTTEYDIAYVTIPKTAIEYEYKIYASSDNTDGFGKGGYSAPVSTGKTSTDSSITYRFDSNSDINAVYVEVAGLKGTFSMSMKVGITFHLDWNAEQEKIQSERVNPEGNIMNMSYMRMLDEAGVNKAATDDGYNYEGSMADELKAMDSTYYKEYLYRRYSNVWLRPAVTTLGSETTVGGSKNVDKVYGNGKIFYASTTGTIKADNNGNLNKFAVYALMSSPYMRIDPELADVYYSNDDGGQFFEGIQLTGSGVSQGGSTLDSDDFNDHVEYSVTTLSDGRKLIMALFDFTDQPLDMSQQTSVTVRYPVRINEADLQTNSSTTYTVNSYTFIYDSPIDTIKGSSIQYDIQDIDGNHDTTQRIAASVHSVNFSNTLLEWNDSPEKAVKTYDSSEYIGSANPKNVQTYAKTNEDDVSDKTKYSYRLMIEIGNVAVTDAAIFDNIETLPDTYPQYSEETWHGTLESIDTTQITKGAIAGEINVEVYCRTSTYDWHKAKNTDLDGEWLLMKTADHKIWTLPDGVSADQVKSIAVKLYPEKFAEPVAKRRLYAEINMSTPVRDDNTNIGKTAYNEFGWIMAQWDSSIQQNVYGQPKASEVTQVKLQAAKPKITVRKVDKDSGALLTGAVFDIYDETKTNILLSGLTANNLNVITVEELEAGKIYYYKETQSPVGYVNDTEFHPLNTDDNGNAVILGNDDITINIENTKMTGKLTFVKKDLNNKDITGVADAVYNLYNGDGELLYVNNNGNHSYSYSTTGVVTELTTGPDGSFTIDNLSWGKYYLKEVTSPKGYNLNTTPVNFEVRKNGRTNNNEIVVSAVQKDAEITQSLRLVKTDQTNNSPLAGARFNLEKLSKDDEGNDEWVSMGKGYEYLSTNVQGEIVVNGLYFGTYRFREINAPTGYSEVEGISEVLVLSADTVDNDVYSDDGGKTVQMTNKRNPGSAVLTKLSTEDGSPLEGAKFHLYRIIGERDGISADGTTNTETDDLLVASVTTNSTGQTPKVTNLIWDKYYFQEVSAPKGYAVSNVREIFEINASNADITQDITVMDTQIKGSVELTKIAGEEVHADGKTYQKDAILDGVEFELYQSDGTQIFAVLNDGVYTYSENKELTAEDGTTVTLDGKYITDINGKIKITGLPWGAYYFRETKALNGFAIADDVHFTVNANTCMSTQELVCKDMKAMCEITIDKHINDRVETFGNPSFLFRITNSDPTKPSYFTTVTLSEGVFEASRTINVEPGTYTITEVPVMRYTLDSIEKVESGTTGNPNFTKGGTGNKQYAEVTLDSLGEVPDTVEVRFNNTLTRYDKYTHTDCIVNTVAVAKQITGISVEYDAVSQPINGGNADTIITLDKSRFNLVLTYDDGTTSVVEQTDEYGNETDDWKRFSPTVSINYEKAWAGQSYQFDAEYTDLNGTTFNTKFTIAFAPLKAVKTKRVIFRTDTTGNSYFNTDGTKTSANTVYYNDADGNWTVNETSLYLTPETILGYTFIGWSKVPDTDTENYKVDFYSQADISAYLSQITENTMTLYACVVDSRVVDYGYTGTVQTFTAPVGGTYKLEVWGAQGGSSVYSSTDTYPNGGFNDENVIPVEGGRGGYSTAEVYLKAGQTIYITVGGKGGEICYKQYKISDATVINGGYNGGGEPVYSDNQGDTYIGGGGGATSVTLTFRNNTGEEILYNETTMSTDGLLSCYEQYKDDVLLVAGGGGGSGYYQNIGTNFSHHGLGGAGGGLISEGNHDNDSKSMPITNVGPSTQTEAGQYISGNSYAKGSFGQGAVFHGNFGSSSGGGGWFGGSCTYLQGGAGGSGYVSNATLNGYDIVGESIIGNLENGMPTYNGAMNYGFNRDVNNGEGELITSDTMTGNQGDGHARITYIPETKDFEYTGTVQTFTATASGYYRLETWGASGGDAKTTESFNQSGGRGGYSTGTVYLNTGDILYICVGGQGITGKGDGWSKVTVNGGYNGGGAAFAGFSYSSDNYFGSGGGATHIARKLQSTGVLSDYVDNKDDIMLVAGGGGGAYYFKLGGYFHHSAGGVGGGLEGGTAYDYYSSISDRPADEYAGTGGKQSADSGKPGLIYGTFGQGAARDGSGGGGWYGGAARYGGGGGSGYVGAVDGKTYRGDETFLSPAGEEETGHLGNGYARITYAP